MLRKVTLRNFRGHENTTVPLSQFTLLVGDNSVGKSSVLESLFFTGQALSKAPSELLRGRWSKELLQRSGTHETTSVALKFDSGDATFAVRANALAAPMSLGWGDQEYPLYSDDDRTAALKKLPSEMRFTRSTVVLRLDAKTLASESEAEDENPRVEFDGTGLPTALAHLKLTEDARFQELSAAVRQVVPTIKEIGFEKKRRTRVRDDFINVEGNPIRVKKDESYIADGLKLRFHGTEMLPATVASEGTMLTIGLLAFLYAPERPNLLLIDDIDRGLHPRAQHELIAAIRRVLATSPRTQVIASSHSPYLVDAFSKEEVVVLSRPSGLVVARQLSEHPDAKVVKTLSTGEFLHASGSDWFGL